MTGGPLGEVLSGLSAGHEIRNIDVMRKTRVRYRIGCLLAEVGDFGNMKTRFVLETVKGSY
jgi:hypothetical protein